MGNSRRPCSFGCDRHSGFSLLHDSLLDLPRCDRSASGPLRSAWLAVLIGLSVGGCGGEEERQTSDMPADVLYNSIEAAREAKPAGQTPPKRLGVLAAADLPADLRTGSACRLMQGERLLLHAAASGAVARIDGRPRRLRIAGPVGPSGGFFAGDGITISVGRQVPPVGEGYEPPAPATASIGNAVDPQVEQVAGMWACLPVGVTPGPSRAAAPG